jgi:hypothetical protein
MSTSSSQTTWDVICSALAAGPATRGDVRARLKRLGLANKLWIADTMARLAAAGKLMRFDDGRYALPTEGGEPAAQPAPESVPGAISAAELLYLRGRERQLSRAVGAMVGMLGDISTPVPLNGDAALPKDVSAAEVEFLRARIAEDSGTINYLSRTLATLVGGPGRST